MNLIEPLPKSLNHLKGVEIDWDQLLRRSVEVEAEVLLQVPLDPVRLDRLQSQALSRSTLASLPLPSSSGSATVPSESSFRLDEISADDVGSLPRSISPILSAICGATWQREYYIFRQS